MRSHSVSENLAHFCAKNEIVSLRSTLEREPSRCRFSVFQVSYWTTPLGPRGLSFSTEAADRIPRTGGVRSRKRHVGYWPGIRARSRSARSVVRANGQGQSRSIGRVARFTTPLSEWIPRASYAKQLERGVPSLKGYGLRKLFRWVRLTGGALVWQEKIQLPIFCTSKTGTLMSTPKHTSFSNRRTT